MAGGGDFATGFFGSVGQKMDEHLDRQRQKENDNKDYWSDFWSKVIQDPNASQVAKERAWQELQKLHPDKESKGLLQKFQTLFHLGGALHKAQQAQSQQPMSEETPIGESSVAPPGTAAARAQAATQPNPNIMAPQVPGKAGPTPPPEAASLFPALSPQSTGGGPTPPPPPTAQAQAPPGAASPKAAGGKTQKQGTKAATSPTKQAAPFPTGAFPTEDQLLENYRKKADIDADAAAKKSTARRAPNSLGEWIAAYKAEHGGQGPSSQEIIDFNNKTRGGSQKPMNLKEAEYFKLMDEGKTEEAQAILAQMSAAKTAEKGKPNTGTTALALTRQLFDPNVSPEDKKVAKASLSKYYQDQQGLQMARGKGYAMYRAMYQLNPYLDRDTGEQVVMSNYDAAQKLKAGVQLVQVGKLSANQVAAAQKFVQESVPAIGEARKYLKAYDNDSDKLVFARVMDELGPAPSGQEVSWIGNVLDQALTHNELSPEARKLIPRLIRLKETVGSLRQSLGAPATDSSMALMLSLIPGPTTPDAAYANDLLDQFEQNARNSVEIPILRSAVSGVRKGGGPTPPPGGGTKLGPKATDYLNKRGVNTPAANTP